MKTPVHEEPIILAAAERQMQAWARTEEIRDRASHAQSSRSSVATAYVTISREAGAGGSEIGRLVGEKLGWEVHDKNLLDRVAERFHLSRMMLDLVDETESNWVYDVLGTWMDRKIVPHEKYLVALGRVVLATAQRGNCVFVGRGAQFLLPRQKIMAVRIIAPEKYRIKQIVERRGLSAAAARQYIEAIDRGRREFVERFFHDDVRDPHLYDMVINAERVGPIGTAEQIASAALRQRAGIGIPVGRIS